MQLCIDWGNTRVKSAIFNGTALVQEFNFSEAEALTGIMGLVNEHNPQSAILCSVAAVPPELKALLQDQTRLHILNGNTALPILNAYHSPDTLGMDRIALAVGAHQLMPGKNVLAISAGTAITYNLLLSNRIFRGGNITPGLDMRFRALHEYTDQLPMISDQGELLLLGYDTETSIRSGVVFGIAAEIDGMINKYREQYSDVEAVLTGGNAGLFADKLKNRIFAVPQLLLQGLNTILLHNAR
jgi:type III pantothenate kinase